MKKNLEELKEYISKLENFKLPDYKEIVQTPLYMEQVVSYIEGILKDISNSDKEVITSYMINNYVKAKIVEPPINKKYNPDHIGYLIAITLLKTSVSMHDLATLIDIDKYYSEDKEKLYNFFKEIHDQTLKNTTHRVKIRLETLEKDKKKFKKNNILEENKTLGYIALRLYIESETSKIIADTLMNKISNDVINNESYNLSKKKGIKYENKKEHKEAKKLANRK